jgi:hypothetical protein
MVYIHVDNFFRDARFPNNNETTFTYPLSRPVNGVEMIKLKHATLPVMQTVIAGWNDRVYFFNPNGDSTTQLVAVVPAGWYTYDEYIAALNTVMTAAATANTFASTYNQNSGKFTIIGSDTHTFSTRLSVETTFGALNAKIFERASRLLGYANQPWSPATSFTLQWVADFVSVRYFTIDLDVNNTSSFECINRRTSTSFVVHNTSNNMRGRIFHDEGDNNQYNSINVTNANVLRISTFLEDSSDENTNELVGFRFEYMFEFTQAAPYALKGPRRPL